MWEHVRGISARSRRWASCCGWLGGRWDRIVTRVVADAEASTDRFANLRRVGIDEISYKRGHKYLTVVVDHDTGVLVWAHPDRDQKTLGKFFDRLGDERCAAITLVSADAAGWIATVVETRCKNAELCLDPFHIVAWATKALDEVHREVWNAARRQGQHALAKELKNARYALWKNPDDLTARQEAKLASIAQTNQRLYRPTCSKSSSVRCSPSRATTASPCWLSG
jgi:transposase